VPAANIATYGGLQPPCQAAQSRPAALLPPQTAFEPDTAYTGIYNSGFIFLLGLLGSQWAMVGYDTAAHMVEETVGAEISGAGLCHLLSLLGMLPLVQLAV
jgi:hypothetical protein